MRRIQVKSIILFTFLFVILLFGFTSFRVYDYYEVPEVDTDFLNNTDQYTLYANQITLDEDCDCIVTADIYKGVFIENIDFDFYIAVISVDIDMNDDLSTQTLSEYDSIESVTINYDMSAENDYNLANYTSAEWGEHTRGFELSLSWNKFIGKKSIEDSLNKVGYMHSGTSTVDKVYNGHFDFNDYTDDSHVESMIIIQVPRGDAFTFTFTYKIEMKHTKLSIFSFRKSEIIGSWKTVTVAQSI